MEQKTGLSNRDNRRVWNRILFLAYECFPRLNKDAPKETDEYNATQRAKTAKRIREQRARAKSMPASMYVGHG
mgnify:FL=1